MAIDRETFDRSTEEELKDLSASDHVLGFLATNDDQAFKATEIAKRTNLDESAVSTALTRLKQRDLVDHKATYWAITDEERRLRQYDGYARATALFNEQLGEEERAAWKQHASDAPHPSRSEDES